MTNLEDASAFHADASVQPRGEAGAPTKKRRQLCRFYGTKKGQLLLPCVRILRKMLQAQPVIHYHFVSPWEAPRGVGAA